MSTSLRKIQNHLKRTIHAARGFVDDRPGRDEELVGHFMDILKRGILA
jgi:hypothetical protein